jgi:hypothetical protein
VWSKVQISIIQEILTRRQKERAGYRMKGRHSVWDWWHDFLSDDNVQKLLEPICATEFSSNSKPIGLRAIVSAVISRLPTAAARVRAQARSCGICGGQSDTGAGFLRVLRFPLPILIPLTAPHSSSSIIRGWYNRTIIGRRTKWTQSHPSPRNLKKKTYRLIDQECVKTQVYFCSSWNKLCMQLRQTDGF